ncbi:hypothetical protein BC833DRAFT_660777 [Globomyces pollinis-pini]|nr:hypothetical protein BC833DRAFT_660777 [Globomyces pollinis-pini]
MSWNVSMKTISHSVKDHVVLVATTLISIGASIFCLVACCMLINLSSRRGRLLCEFYLELYVRLDSIGDHSKLYFHQRGSVLLSFDFYYVYLVVGKYDTKNNQREILSSIDAFNLDSHQFHYLRSTLINLPPRRSRLLRECYLELCIGVDSVGDYSNCISTNIDVFVKNQSLGKTVGHISEKKSAANKE